jgi:hypothetical protein
MARELGVLTACRNPTPYALGKDIRIPRAIAKYTFPHDKDSPSFVEQLLLRDFISLNICGKFVAPERAIRRRQIGVAAARMAVPEASVDEDRHAIFGKHDVRSAWQAWAVQAVSKSLPMQKATE